MPVIINEFDLDVEAPAAGPPGGDGAPAARPEPSPLRPLDLRDAWAQQLRRAERLRAH